MSTMHQVLAVQTVNDPWETVAETDKLFINQIWFLFTSWKACSHSASSGASYPVWLLPKVMLLLRKYKLKWRVICCEADKLSEGWWGKSSAEDREGRIARGKTEPVLLSKHHNMCWNLTNYICPSPLCSIRCKYWNKHKQNACLAGLCAMQNWIEGAF